MAVKPVLVCDVCGQDGDVEAYTVVYPDGMRWEVDLCGRHSGDLVRYRKNGTGREVKRRQGRATFRVTPVEEIKGKARKRP